MKYTNQKVKRFQTGMFLVYMLVMVLQDFEIMAQSWSISGNTGTSGSSNFLGNIDNVGLKIRTNNSVRMNITSNGKIAIGTHSPVFKLDIRGGSVSADSMYRISGAPVISRNGANQVQLGDATAAVGIGTSSPTQKLEVAGMIFSSSGGFKFPDGSVQTTAGLTQAANQQLSNLGSTAIHTDLLPGTDGLHELGNGSLRWLGVNSNDLNVKKPGIGQVANFEGTSEMFLKFSESGSYRGYIGSYSGAAEDMDFGTGVGNISGSLHLTIQGTPEVTLASNGKVGMGTMLPSGKLHVSYVSSITDPQIKVQQNNNDYARISLTNTTSNNYWTIAGMSSNTNNQGRLNFYNNISGNVMCLTGNGSVCIGTGTPATGYKLSVAGKIICTEMKVQMQANWPDYVFDQNYQLPAIEEVKQFINRNHHLPGVPSAAELNAQAGFELGSMQATLLKKVEELTLYLLQQQEEINRLKALYGENQKAN